VHLLVSELRSDTTFCHNIMFCARRNEYMTNERIVDFIAFYDCDIKWNAVRKNINIFTKTDQIISLRIRRRIFIYQLLQNVYTFCANKE